MWKEKRGRGGKSRSWVVEVKSRGGNGGGRNEGKIEG